MFETPILILIFNRPDLTQSLLEVLRLIRPSKLYISADGPRTDRAGEEELCRLAREKLKTVDWECEIKTNFYKENQGCRLGVSQGISWFFEQEEQGIILEDDCIPNISFFRFCEELLLKYKHEPSIWMISGNHPFTEITKNSHSSYFFTTFPFIWGWASWRSAWQNYDLEMKDLEENADIFTKTSFLQNHHAEAYLWDKFIHSKGGDTNTWDFQWFYTILKNNGKCVLPAVNMVVNIGFGEASTHTSGGIGKRNNNAVEISFPLKHPDIQSILSTDQHQHLFYIVFKSKWRLLVWRINNMLKKVLKQK